MTEPKVRDPDEQMEIEARRQQIIEWAVHAAEDIICVRCEGVEEINYVTAEVAKQLVQKAMNPFAARMLKKDLGL